MKPKATVREILQAAHLTARAVPLPVCSGCPDGRFEAACDEWMQVLQRHLIGEFPQSEFVVVSGTTHLLHDGQRLIVAEVVPHRGGGKTLRIVTESQAATLSLVAGQADLDLPPGDIVYKPDDVDRIELLLDGQAKLAQQVHELKGMVMARDAHLGGLIQRVMLLVNHYGHAPWSGFIQGLFGARWVTLERPLPKDTVK